MGRKQESRDVEEIGRPLRKKSRIQVRNVQKILASAEDVFAEFGFHGATIEEIAVRADMSQPNIHHYFRRKSDLYEAVIKRTLDVWLAPLEQFHSTADPAKALSEYISAKFDLSQQYPAASRVFANEILQGAPVLMDYLIGEVKPRVETAISVLSQWAQSGKIKAINPYHLIFMIWATTQHYADFQPQIRAVMGLSRFTKKDFEAAKQTATSIIIAGVLTTPPK
jgi:TetR/AcrR family transcriptional regulator